MNYEYYYNDVPGEGKSRNNLVYTSLISKDKKTFVKWYYNDTNYHQGKNQVVNENLMDEKWQRELKYLIKTANFFPDIVPKILDIDYKNKKIYLEIDGFDFWNKAQCDISQYNNVLPDWQDQMLNIIEKHNELNFYKYSLHPSSYFIVNNKLKSINYFFCYDHDEPYISIKNVESHIHINRQNIMKKYLDQLGISWDVPQPWAKMNKLCLETFRTNYPTDFISKALKIV